MARWRFDKLSPVIGPFFVKQRSSHPSPVEPDGSDGDGGRRKCLITLSAANSVPRC